MTFDLPSLETPIAFLVYATENKQKLSRQKRAVIKKSFPTRAEALACKKEMTRNGMACVVIPSYLSGARLKKRLMSLQLDMSGAPEKGKRVR